MIKTVIKTWIGRLQRNERGATAIEFAIVLPVFFFLVMGTLEFGLIMHVSSVVEHAAHEGARKGITGNDYDDPDGDRGQYIETYIRRNVGRWVFDPTQLAINTKVLGEIQEIGMDGNPIDTNSGYGGGDQVVIYQVRYNWRVITPFLRGIIGVDEDSFPITSTVAVKNEGFCGRASCYGS